MNTIQFPKMLAHGQCAEIDKLLSAAFSKINALPNAHNRDYAVLAAAIRLHLNASPPKPVKTHYRRLHDGERPSTHAGKPLRILCEV